MNPYDLLVLSALSYKKPCELKSTKEVFENYDIEEKDITYYSSDVDAQYYCLKFREQTVFVMRGTSSMEDAIADVKVYMTKFLGTYAHSGFLSQYLSINSSIINTIRYDEAKEIIFVGHSLGGALATLAAAESKQLFPYKCIKCCTFGSPRVGNESFVKLFNSTVDTSIRCINGDDMVTKNPRIFYYHVKGKVLVGEKTHWSCIWQKYLGSIEDHFLENYKKALENNPSFLEKM